MHAAPRVGMPEYAQGFAPPPVSWNDHARIRRSGVSTCVPAGCFKNVLVTAEFNPGERGVAQLKYYAPGLGNIRVGYVGNDESKEVLELMRVVHLSPAALAAARAEALKIEARAYRSSKAVYGTTAPAERIR
jgi:hypothetical protein